MHLSCFKIHRWYSISFNLYNADEFFGVKPHEWICLRCAFTELPFLKCNQDENGHDELNCGKIPSPSNAVIDSDPGVVSRAGRKSATKVFKHKRKSPWVPTLTGPFPNVQALYYCAQSANSNSWVFFVSSYTTAIDSIAARLALATKKCTQSGNFQFDINSPFQNTLYPKTKDAFAKYKLDLTIGIHACIDHAFVNIREFKMPRQPTATKTSHEKWSHIFSVSIMIIPTRLLCQMQTNSSGAKFLSTISKLIKRKKIMSLMFTFFTKREIRHFHVVVVQWRLRNVQTSVMHVQNCCFVLSSYSFFYFLITAASLRYVVIRREQNFLSASWIAPDDSIRNVFRLIDSFFVSG